MKLNRDSNTLKVGTDLFTMWLKWSGWFLSFLVVGYFLLNMFSIRIGSANEVLLALTTFDFISASFNPTQIYMLILGILSAYVFVHYFVSFGVTRKEYFTGSVLGAVTLSIILAVIAFMITVVSKVIVDILNLSITFDRADYLYFDGNWFLSLLVFSLIIFTYFCIGWLISVGYYRYGWIYGFLFIAAAIVSLGLLDTIWKHQEGEGFSRWFPLFTDNPSLLVSVLVNLVIIGVLLLCIRVISKSMTVKM